MLQRLTLYAPIKATATKLSAYHGVNQHKKFSGFSPKQRQQFPGKNINFCFVEAIIIFFLNQELENIGR